MNLSQTVVAALFQPEKPSLMSFEAKRQFEGLSKPIEGRFWSKSRPLSCLVYVTVTNLHVPDSAGGFDGSKYQAKGRCPNISTSADLSTLNVVLALFGAFLQFRQENAKLGPHFRENPLAFRSYARKKRLKFFQAQLLSSEAVKQGR